MKTFNEYIRNSIEMIDEETDSEMLDRHSKELAKKYGTDKPDLADALARRGQEPKNLRYTWEEREAIKKHFKSGKFKKGLIPIKWKEPQFAFKKSNSDDYKDYMNKKWHSMIRAYGKYEDLRGWMLDDWLFDAKELFWNVCANDLSDKMLQWVFDKIMTEKKPEKFQKYATSLPREAMWLIKDKLKNRK